MPSLFDQPVTSALTWIRNQDPGSVRLGGASRRGGGGRSVVSGPPRDKFADFPEQQQRDRSWNWPLFAHFISIIDSYAWRK